MKTFSELYNDALQQADMKSGDGSADAKTMIKAGINESYAEIAGIKDWKTLENSTTVSTVSGTIEYTPITSSSSVPRIRRIQSVLDLTNNRYLEETKREIFEKIYPNPSETGGPTTWIMSGYDSNRDMKIKLYPIPNSVLSLKVIFTEEPLELSNDVDQPRIPDQFHYGLTYLGLAKYFEFEKDPIANYYRTLHDQYKQKILDIEWGESDEMPQFNLQDNNRPIVTGKIGRVWNR